MPLIGTGINAAQVHTAPTGKVWVAAYGAALPTNSTTAMATVDPNYKDLGYLTTDGVSFSPDLTKQDFFAWQALPPVKTTVTAMSLPIKISLEQVNQTTVGLYFFGGTWSNPAGGVSKLHVSSTPALTSYTVVVEWSDDAGYLNRMCINKAFLTTRDALQLQRAGLSTLGITFEAQDDSGNFFDVYSNDPQLLSS